MKRIGPVRLSKVYGFRLQPKSKKSSVVNPDPIGNADPDPGARKSTIIDK